MDYRIAGDLSHLASPFLHFCRPHCLRQLLPHLGLARSGRSVGLVHNLPVDRPPGEFLLSGLLRADLECRRALLSIDQFINS